MKKYSFLLAFTFGIFLVACGGGADKPVGDKSSKSQTAKADAPDGKKIYKTYCIACHGIYGNSSINNAKDFTESTLNVDERFLVIKNGRNTMQAFGSILSDEKIRAVAEYTMTFSED